MGSRVGPAAVAERKGVWGVDESVQVAGLEVAATGPVLWAMVVAMVMVMWAGTMAGVAVLEHLGA